jgi:hypothetical protein
VEPTIDAYPCGAMTIRMVAGFRAKTSVAAAFCQRRHSAQTDEKGGWRVPPADRGDFEMHRPLRGPPPNPH